MTCGRSALVFGLLDRPLNLESCGDPAMPSPSHSQRKAFVTKTILRPSIQSSYTHSEVQFAPLSFAFSGESRSMDPYQRFALDIYMLHFDFPSVRDRSSL